MNYPTSLPKNWKDFKIDNKIVFVNLSEKVISFHPPIEISNIGSFLNIYNFKCNKEEFLKVLSPHSKETSSTSIILSKGIEGKNMPKIESNISNQSNQRELLELTKIDDDHQLKLLKDFWEENKNDLQVVLKKVFLEKYKCIPNFEYKIDTGILNKPTYICYLKIKNENLLKGESLISKVKAREEVIKKSLKLLLPGIYKTFIKEEIEISDSKSSNESLFSSECSKICDYVDLNSSKVSRIFPGDFDNSNISSILNNYTSNSPLQLAEPIKNEFLGKKRKNELEDKKEKKLIIEDEDYVFGGCLVEDLYSNLQIDDPLVVDKYLKCSNFTPLAILTTFKNVNPKIDIKENTYIRNDGIKFDHIKNDNYIKVVIESQSLNIKVESAYDNKKLAREYCAQKFLKKLYQGRFSKWVELLNYYEEKGYNKDRL